MRRGTRGTETERGGGSFSSAVRAAAFRYERTAPRAGSLVLVLSTFLHDARGEVFPPRLVTVPFGFAPRRYPINDTKLRCLEPGQEGLKRRVVGRFDSFDERG